MKESFHAAILKICADTENGSSVLLHNYLDTLKEFSPSTEDLKWSAEEIRKISREMIILHHIADWAQSLSGKDIRKSIVKYEKKWSRLADVHFINLLRHQQKRNIRVLIHSASGSVFKLLIKMREEGMVVKVYQTESEPEGEGIIQFNSLKEEGFGVELVYESSIPRYLEQADYVLLGMDSYDDYFFVNKKGSLEICDQAKIYNTPVFLLYDSRKYISKCYVERSAFEVVPFTPIVTMI